MRFKRFFGWLSKIFLKLQKPLLTFFVFLLSITAGSLAGYWYPGIIEGTYPSPPPDDQGAPTDGDQTKEEEVYPRPAERAPSPINGVIYKEEEALWQNRRPLAIMVDNHYLARPFHNGISSADIIYEVVAEGGITRLLGIFHGKDEEKIGPVRSARVYYIQLSQDYQAYYSHIGGAGTLGSPANIFVYIKKYGILDLDQFKLGTRAYDFAGYVTQPSGSILSKIFYTSTDRLWAEGDRLYSGTNTLPEFSSWQFKEDLPEVQRPSTQRIDYKFWDVSYSISSYGGYWQYDKATNTYKRFQAGASHVDKKTGQQIAAKNVIIQKAKEKSALDGTSHRLYDVIGSGQATVYRDGRAISATWKKDSLTARTIFYEKITGKEVIFNRGLIWVEVEPI